MRASTVILLALAAATMFDIIFFFFMSGLGFEPWLPFTIIAMATLGSTLGVLLRK